MNAIERLRDGIGAPDTDGYNPRVEDAIDALTAVEALYQAAKRVERDLGQEKADGGGERDAAYYALAAAVRRVEGE